MTMYLNTIYIYIIIKTHMCTRRLETSEQPERWKDQLSISSIITYSGLIAMSNQQCQGPRIK